MGLDKTIVMTVIMITTIFMVKILSCD
uniref:Uncharacterized protein n=1 Tax=Rhizophora mucronata TaxID=61149 RepID=A0A2P2IPM5_RHIMU